MDLWMVFSTLMFLHHYHASSVHRMRPTVEERPLVQLHHRDKRCSCENQKDKECIFYCHIGIVWVNTPSHVVPYGFGSVRLRRETSRCVCYNSQDTQCFTFCSIYTPEKDEDAEKTNGQKRQPEGFWEKRGLFKHQT